jgi:hypothetical protein
MISIRLYSDRFNLWTFWFAVMLAGKGREVGNASRSGLAKVAFNSETPYTDE